MTRKRLREGFTTGSAAAAAAKAALLFLLGQKQGEVEIPLPVGGRIRIPVRSAERKGAGARATVVKDGGDDPDVTNKAIIGATVFLEKTGKGISIEGGKGVGKVTRQGLPVLPGRPAINPVPMQQIADSLTEGLIEAGVAGAIRAVIDVENGEEIAKKTLNPRLGITGGISILGTRGTVKPFSHESYRETIRISMNVAREAGLDTVCLSTGGKSEGFLRNLRPELPEISFIQVADFFSFSLREAAKQGFQQVLYACFFGKLVKMAKGHEYTHAKESRIDFALLSQWCKAHGMEQKRLPRIRNANTAREALSVIMSGQEAKPILQQVIGEALQKARSFAGPGPKLDFHLFDTDGALLCRAEASR
ncbi:MAG: cobalt-precorrin-5B (C(1))-methyltransferase [Desulfobacteraceae bacterium]|nr:MAG: cobalt-precorrin-5B (C(1))-methyltransferase [Desulfobacteraceae bacterium]